MHDIHISSAENTPRDVVAIGNTYVPQTVLAPHRHGRAQLLYASTGAMTVDTEGGSWVVPPTRAVWIPAGMLHSVRISGSVQIRSLYIRPAAAARRGLPQACCVIAVSHLLAALLEAAVDLPPLYALQGRDARVMALALDEIRAMPVQPLSASLPREPRLRALCTALLEAPAHAGSIDAVARQVSMSRSRFTRLFRQQTGLSFGAWLTQARLLYALREIAGGASITQVALAAGYSTPSAFSAAFRQALGETPSRYFHRDAAQPGA